ncbi:hypothetical protein AKJ09_09751 [Labilithrix luteola]|uniref:Uncharacterized protein n=1 Tax=Labilithrix luteola TaxID=1391654 RepID=A0A0K1QBH7_9BACT|nr:hypothetical protein [Labilithrix luteola]AKV03088.1 hypothetical protein AKJ09_09751 [Labilithrix luteola]
MTLPIDIAALPGPAQKILDPNGPAPLKAMAAKGVVPGLKPGDTLAVVVLLSLGEGAPAEQAKKTLENLPAPLLNGALGGSLQPGVLDVIAPLCAKDAAVAEKVLLHPSLHPETVASMAAVSSELVCELIATNEERLLANPAIIEKLYLNKHTRMSTADRILELAVRNKIELKGIPAFEQAAAAIAGELIAEATEEPSFDDTQFNDVEKLASEVQLADGDDTHALNDETGQEEVTELLKPLHAIWADLRPPAKIRMLQLATLKVYDEKGREVDEVRLDAKAVRMLGVRDANPLVAVAAIKAPGMGDSEVVRIAGLRNICEDVLREIAMNREWTRHYMVKYNLVANPRTPFGHAAKWITYLRENDLKTIAKSKEVPGAVQTAARQQLQRKGK